ncbi:MAG: asparagine--tRNA ligase, partial [Candidatus Micrarchaeia archaeon]
ESSIKVKGIVKRDERAPGGFELALTNIEVISQGEPFPISKDLSTEFLLDMRHLWVRSQQLTNIFKGRNYVIKYLREFFENEGFYEIAPPIITKSGAEGGSDVFEINYFGEKAYLTQSSQLYAEAFVFSLGKVYVFAPSFRAEPSRTRRHLAEYWHLEPEMAFYNEDMNIELQERMIEHVCQRMAKNHPELLEKIGRDPNDLKRIRAPFQRMSYEKAVERVNELGGKMEYGQDFGADEEYILTKDMKIPISVTNYPADIKAFYMREDPKKPGTALNNDMLAPEGYGEIIGGSERIWDYNELVEKIERFKLNRKDYEWYIDLRRYGSVPHSGFGLGIERFIMWLFRLEHIRDAIPFPRTINRAYP